MPCFFCIAVFATVAGAAVTASVDAISERLERSGVAPLRRTADTSSVAKLEFDLPHEGRGVPVAVTLFKRHARVRIQVLTHDVTPEGAEKVQNRLADLLDLRVVDRSGPDEHAAVHHAMDTRDLPPAPPETARSPRTPAPPQ